MDVHVTSVEFHQNAGVPFLNALLSEIDAAFDIESTNWYQQMILVF